MRPAPRPRGRSVRAWLRVQLIAVAALAPALAVSPAAPGATPVRAADGFRLEVAEQGDFVTQHTDVACVGASVQMMLNMIRDGADRTRATQARALRTAQRVSNPVFVRRSGGASARGWAYALERLGGGPYRVRAYATRAAALRAVAVAIRATGRPAGLLVWQGAHAWVASGFRTSGDPTSGRFSVRGLTVNDPWWPRPTGSHGRTLEPGTVLSPAELDRHFVRFQRGPRRGGSILNGDYVVVLPVDPAAVAARAERML